MIKKLRVLWLAFVISSISAAAVVPPEVSLMFNDAEGPQMPPPEQWKIDGNDYSVAMPDISDFRHPALLCLGTAGIGFSLDGQTFVPLNIIASEYCSVGKNGSLCLLPKDKGFLRIVPSEYDRCNVMIIDLPEADVAELGVESTVDLAYEVLVGTQADDGIELVQEGNKYNPRYVGKIRWDLGDKKGNVVHFNMSYISSSSITMIITAADGSVYEPEISSSDLFYLPEGSRTIEVNISTTRTGRIDNPVVSLLTYAAPAKASTKYVAFTILDSRDNNVYREHFYDFNGDGSFSIVADRSGNPVLTTLYPDGKVYGLDQKGHRLTRYDGSGREVIFDESNYKKSLVPFDYNNDGKYDFKYGDDVYTIDNDGNLNLDALTLLTPGQYEGLRSELKLSTGGEGVPGMGDMFGYDGGSIATSGVGTFADFNADGLTDVLVYMNNSDSYHTDVATTLFLNTGKDRTLIYTSAPEVELVRDFDGDGLVDMVKKESDGLKIYHQRRGQASQVVNVYRGFTGTVLGARDVDNDGDVDLIVSAGLRVSPGYDYYVAILENQGNGKFAKHENFLINSDYNFKFDGILGILDVDADGKYEIIFKHYDNGTQLCCVKIESASKLGEIVKIKDLTNAGSTVRYSIKTIIPINNDGRMAYLDAEDSENKVLLWATDPAWGVNSRPARPVAPTLSYDPATRRLCVSWPAGSDAETPTADLTYELRVGTSEGAGDIVAANALPDGTRRNIADGNNGFVCEKVYDVSTWPTGKIYVSYQVVDGGWRGSEFSPAAVFENDRPAVGIAMKAGIPGVGKPFEAWLENGPVAGSAYAWTCSDGGIIEVLDADRQRVSLTFGTPGVKVITLTATDSQGRTATATRKIDVYPQVINVFGNYITPGNAIDLDGDGVAELNSHDGFYVQNPDGTFEKYRRMFNSEGFSGITFDYNRDGLPDIIGSKNVLLNIGDGDMEALRGETALECVQDLNNDGVADTVDGINTGDYKTEHKISGDASGKGFFIDYDGDGLLDNIYGIWDSQNRVYHIMYARNIDGYTFADAVELFASECPLQNVADIDGDGMADIICSDYTYAFGVTTYSEYITVYWGNGSAPTLIQCPDGCPFGSISYICDFDNNGVLDMIVSLQSGHVVVYLYADHSYVNHTERVELHGKPFINAAGNYRAFYGEFELASPNKLPEPPTGLRAAQSAKDVVIEWNAGSDAETPASALRYNISVKHKGAEGENAYLISPMNGDNDQAPLPMPIRLLSSTKFTIPIASIPAGDYEIKLQTVDTHMGASRFSETLMFTVAEGAYLNLPTTVMLGEAVAVRVHSNYSSNIDFGEGADAQVKSVDSKFTDYTVVWRSEGLKDVKADGKVIAGTMVIAAPDASFTLPEKVLAGATVTIPGAAEGRWEVSIDDAAWSPIGSVSDISTRAEGSDFIMVFAKAGRYALRRTITRSQGDGQAQNVVEVVDEGMPEISLVSCNSDSHYALEWNPAGIPAEVTAVKVYRETESYGVFAFVDEVIPSAGIFTDESSNAAVSASRYRISWLLPYGESEPSVAHQPIHVQINKGLGDAVNLMWSLYQGTQAQSYRILRGTSADNLEILATVSGGISSYTDLQPGGVKYYAVETVVGASAAVRGTRGVRATSAGARSNVVCTSEARDMALAQSIAIISPTGTNVLSMASEHKTLTAAIMPAAASAGRANWEITAGADKASIDAYGRLTYYAPGTITVKATACDGSGVSASQDFEIIYSDVLAESIQFAGGNIRTISVGEQIRIDYTVLPKGAYQRLEWSSPYADSSNPVLSITPDGLITGLREGSELVRASCIDGSGWFDSVNIMVEGLSGVENVINEPSRISVFTADGRIRVAGACAGSQIRIYAFDGSLIAFADADGSETIFSLVPGFYIVYVDGQSFKVRL